MRHVLACMQHVLEDVRHVRHVLEVAAYGCSSVCVYRQGCRRVCAYCRLRFPRTNTHCAQLSNRLALPRTTPNTNTHHVARTTRKELLNTPANNEQPQTPTTHNKHQQPTTCNGLASPQQGPHPPNMQSTPSTKHTLNLHHLLAICTASPQCAHNPPLSTLNTEGTKQGSRMRRAGSLLPKRCKDAEGRALAA